MKKINWGIIGPGRISKIFAEDITLCEGSTLRSVASSSSLERAEKFADSFGATAYGSYAELLADSKIDVVYVGTTHNYHYECAKQVLNSGKALLLEKPFTMNAVQSAELIALATEKKVFLMEAMWTRFHPATQKILQLVNDGVIGKIEMVKADFCIQINRNPDDRLLNKSLGGGALLDLGVYPISFASFFLGSNPIDIRSSALIGETDVDETSTYMFSYDNGAVAMLSSSFRFSSSVPAVIYGEKGRIELDNFLNADKFVLTVNGNEPESISCPKVGHGYSHEIMEVEDCLEKGVLESYLHPLSETLSVMKIMDSIREQWSLYYPGEKNYKE